jgi:uncharacterized protein
MRKNLPNLLVSSLCILFSSLSPAMKNYPPEYYFSGDQLLLAQAIVSGNQSCVIRLAPHTRLNDPGKQDMTLLFYAIQSGVSRRPQQLSIISQLIKVGADPLQDVPDMGSVAEVVATSPHSEFMQALIDGGMNVNVKVQGQPLLHDAASDNTLKTMKLMVSRGADVNATDSLGKPTIMQALDGMQLEAVEWLLNHGANPNAIETNTGWSFMLQLDDVIKRNKGDTGKTHTKLMKIRQLSIEKGGAV